MQNLIFELVLNIALLVLVASLFSKFQMIQESILEEYKSMKSQVILSLAFGGIIILSTCTAIDTAAYPLNTRIIGAMSAGLLGGPIVGLYASLVGSIFVYLFSSPQQFAMAAAFSTMLFGLLGGGFYPYFQRGKWKYTDLFLLACFGEVCDMVSLLRFAGPHMEVLQLILRVSLPMIVFNAVGILIFISNFNHIFILQELERSKQLQVATELSKKILPLLGNGIEKGQVMEKLCEVLLDEGAWDGVVITNNTEIISWKSNRKSEWPIDLEQLSGEIIEIIEKKEVTVLDRKNQNEESFLVIIAPICVYEQVIGSLIVWVKKRWIEQQSKLEMVQYLITIISLQLTSAELEKQTVMRQKAELKALQFQINPHFLFNALNTISCVCREDAEKARTLLLSLASYFRYTLKQEEEMISLYEEIEHIKDYLELEKARFEDQLLIEYDVEEEICIMVPILILQPLVENAVKHGRNIDGKRWVRIEVKKKENEYQVCVSDKGKGFAKEVIQKLENDEMEENKVGLLNVHKRMKSIYGQDHGIKIISDEFGSSVILRFSEIRK